MTDAEARKIMDEWFRKALVECTGLGAFNVAVVHSAFWQAITRRSAQQ